MSRFPAWNIGTAAGIDQTYEVHWLDWDRAQLTVDGDEIVTFSSSHSIGFTTVEGVLDEAAEVIYQMEELQEWD